MRGRMGIAAVALAAFGAAAWAGDADARRKIRTDCKAIGDAIAWHKIDTASYPQRLEDLVKDDGQKGWSGPYLQKLIPDPWGHPYVYALTGEGDPPYQLGSYGKDGKPGGEGDDADIFVSLGK